MMKIKERKICIICEGSEEEEYIEALLKRDVFSKKYHFKKIINAKSFFNILPRYTERFQTNSYDLVLIFCDTDKGPSDKYIDLKKRINKLHDVDVADDIIIFGNPCTMQIILSHFGEIKLTSQSKAVNSEYIKNLTNISNYKATNEQRTELFKKIKKDNYKIMKKNIAKLSTNDKDTSSTNFLKFIENFENDDDTWVDAIISKF